MRHPVASTHGALIGLMLVGLCILTSSAVISWLAVSSSVQGNKLAALATPTLNPNRTPVRSQAVTATEPQIIAVTLSPATLNEGDLLSVSITVKNNSTTSITSQDPQPGFVYNEGETFYTRNFPDVHGAFRIGIDFDGRSGIDHPYRWGLGAPLAPGETRTITGAIRMKNPQRVNYWAGLVQEQVAWWQDRQGVQFITVNGAPGNAQISATTFSPITLRSGDTLNVSITVVNKTNQTLETQGPNPGFVYDEGDTFRSRGFAETRGAFRVGIDFDGRGDIDHPYRWGLGAPLAPGQSATITGAIRLKTARTINYWAGLVREQIAWLQDSAGVQSIRVTAAGSPQITTVTFAPLSLAVDNLLTVSITVRNDSSDTLQTQAPDPGFVYNEGDTFYTRGFAETRGAVRVGVDFDGRSGIDHPYRWGLGSPLAPGQTRVVSGAIRMKLGQSRNYFAGMVQEQVAWLQDRQGTQLIQVIAPPTNTPTSGPTATATKVNTPPPGPTATATKVNTPPPGPTATNTPVPTPTSPPTPSPSDTPIPISYYGTITVLSAPTDRPAALHADLNLALRGYAPTNAALNLIDYWGPTDPIAVQLYGIFADQRTSRFSAAYRVYDWNWECNCRAGLIGDWAVTLLGLQASNGETVRVPIRYADMSNGYHAIVLYADTDRVTLKYTPDDNVIYGYTVHLEGFTVEPSLIALYNTMNGSGRGRLPAVRSGQIVGRAVGSEVKVAIRDSGSFMDPRSRKDWWMGR
ncbi:MAG: hypothetical protein HZB51_11305 [Chloroflexi bacterium]|nr:hypothetical protein [Chloroflexota bacterium]